MGRDGELELLRDRLRQAADGTGRVVFLSAEAGAGKTTLVDHFLGDVQERVPEGLLIRAGCSEQYGAGEPYQPFVEAFRHLTVEREARKGRSLKELAREIAPFWVAAIPVAGEAIAAGMATAAELKRTFGGGEGASTPSEEALFFQYTQLFLAASEDHPIVLFIDDLHWADRASVSLLTHLGRQIADRRVLILGSYRPVDIEVSGHPMRDARQELERYRVAEEVVLGPLDKAGLGGLVQLRAGVPPTPQLLDWLERRGGSNALFFEELLTWLEHQGFTRETHGQLDLVTVPQELEIPRSAESTIEKRLDRLDEESRRVLEYASVDGNEFDSVSLSRLLDIDELELEDLLDPLVKVHRLVQLKETRDLPGDDFTSVYQFSHSLIQSVLHAGLHGKRRILLHRKIGQILEEIWGDRASNVAHKLAIHFEEGRQRDKAFDYALEAAERARHVYAHWDALDQIERALRSAETDTQAALAHQRLGEAYLAIGRYDEAVAGFDQALERLDADGETALLLRHLRLLAERNQGVRPLDDILADLEALRDRARELDQPEEECRIIWNMIDLPGTTASIDVVLAQEALELAEKAEDPWLVASGRKVLGFSLVFDGKPAEAIEPLKLAGQTFGSLGDRSQEAGCGVYTGLAHAFLGDYEKAATELENARAAYDEIVDPDRSAGARTNLARVLRIQGDLNRAEEALLEALQIGERLSSPVVMLTPLQNLAELYLERGEWEGAEGWWRELLDKASATGYATEQIIAHCGVGMVRLREGDLDGALEAERSARALIGEEEDGGGEAHLFLTHLAVRIAATVGETEGAKGMLDPGSIQQEEGDAYLAAFYQVQTAEALLDITPEYAVELARGAVAALRDLGEERLLRRAENILAQAEAGDA